MIIAREKYGPTLYKHPRLTQDQGSNLRDLRYDTGILLRVSQLAFFFF